MGEQTGIQWTDHTFNPWWGCTKISPGCDHCYAEHLSRRFGSLWGAGKPRREFGDKHWRDPVKWNARAEENFGMCRACGWRGYANFEKILHCPKCGDVNSFAEASPRVFCASMADVFDVDAPAGARDRLFELIRATPNLTWQLLTKRIGNVARMLPADWGRGYENVWLGATVVNQAEADRDVPKLLTTPARVRFLSIEPMLDLVDAEDFLGLCNCFVQEFEGAGMHSAVCRATTPRVDWVICGGESGPGARPMQREWARSLRDQCASADVPFFFKQWGEHAPNWLQQDDGSEQPGSMWMDRVGKKAAGRLLDGVEHNAFPEG